MKKSIILTSDPQYPWIDIPYQASEGHEAESEELIRKQYNSINRYIDSRVSDVRGIIVNGDLTAFGHGWQRDKMMDKLLPTLKAKYYLNLGNHDIENNLGDCANDGCSHQMLELMIHHITKVLFIPNGNYDAVYESGFWYDKWYGTYSYLFKYDNNVFIQLQNDPSLTIRPGGTHRTHYAIEADWNFNWLKSKLESAKNNNERVFISVHKPVDSWKSTEGIQNFKNLIGNYNNIEAIFYGHYHNKHGKYPSIANIPTFYCSSPSYSQYLIMEYDDSGFEIFTVKDTSSSTSTKTSVYRRNY